MTKPRTRLGARPGDCLVLYAGTHGISHALPAVADAAARLAGQPVHVAFVGGGADKPRLERRVAELGLTKVTLAPAVSPDQVPGLLAAADICLVPLRDVPLFATFIPSKMFEYLAAAKPVIGSVAGETAQILREAGAVVVPPEDSAALAFAIGELAADPARRAAMGRQGRAYVSPSSTAPNSPASTARSSRSPGDPRGQPRWRGPGRPLLRPAPDCAGHWGQWLPGL